MKKESEFGKGFIYCIVLFAMHTERYLDAKGKMLASRWIGLLFNGAGDHFYELQIPERWQKHEIGKRFEALQDRILEYRLRLDLTEKDFESVLEELKVLCRLIDKELGVDVIKGTYE